MDDIAPQLYEELKKYFDGLIDSDQKIKEIAKLINDGKGRYKDADDYAVRTGQLLSDSFRKKLKSGALPDDKMYYNIANRTVAPMLKDNHKRVTDMCSKVQKALNEANGLNLRAIIPDIDENYIKGIIDHITDIDDLEKLLDYLSDIAVSYSQSVVDSSVRENARFQSESGLTARVYRHFRPGLTNQKAHHEKKYWKCPYCEERACPNGVPYEEVDGTGAWIWQRHPGCNCIIEYKPSRGFKQIVPPTRRREVQKNLERAVQSGKIKKIRQMNLQFFSEADIEKQSSTALKRGIRKHLKQIDKHKEHIQNPSGYIKEWDSYDVRFQEGLKRHWQKEINNFEQSIKDKMEELRKRGEEFEQ